MGLCLSGKRMRRRRRRREAESWWSEGKERKSGGEGMVGNPAFFGAAIYTGLDDDGRRASPSGLWEADAWVHGKLGATCQ
jgi:hypothetical protein